MGRQQFASDVGYLRWRTMPRYDKTGLLCSCKSSPTALRAWCQQIARWSFLGIILLALPAVTVSQSSCKVRYPCPSTRGGTSMGASHPGCGVACSGGGSNISTRRRTRVNLNPKGLCPSVAQSTRPELRSIFHLTFPSFFIQDGWYARRSRQGQQRRPRGCT